MTLHSLVSLRVEVLDVVDVVVGDGLLLGDARAVALVLVLVTTASKRSEPPPGGSDSP